MNLDLEYGVGLVIGLDKELGKLISKELEVG